MEHKKVETSPEVWAVIRARHHKELVPFGTYSYPDGDPNGDHERGCMYTEYGFKTSACPLIASKTVWDIDSEKSYERHNEKTIHWLCLPIEPEEG